MRTISLGFAFKVFTDFSPRFVEAVLNSVIEKNEKARVASGGLIAAMLSRGLLGEVKDLQRMENQITLNYPMLAHTHAPLMFAGTIPLRLGQPAPVC